MKKNRIIAITGITGVGKDYLVERANQTSKLKVVNTGTLIGKELGANRDLMMAEIEPTHIRAAQISVYSKVISIQPVIVTCHAIHFREGAYRYDQELENILSPMQYVFVCAPAQLIADRIQKRNESGERKSPVLSIQQIEEEQSQKLRVAKEMCSAMSCKLLVINNTDEDLQNNIHKLKACFWRIA